MDLDLEPDFQIRNNVEKLDPFSHKKQYEHTYFGCSEIFFE